MKRLAIITSHPIQYYAPWFRYLAQADLTLCVFYLWDFGVTETIDPGFQQAFQWDIPLLSGYDFQFVPNTSADPGTHHFWGLQNPSLIAQVKQFAPDAVLLMNYNFASLYQFLWRWRDAPLLFRGDSHRLVPQFGFKAAIRRKMISLIYRRFSGCLYVGKANAEYFRFHDVPSERLFFSPHAIDNDRFISQAETARQAAVVWKQELGIPSNHAVILFAGKLEKKKRPLDLLGAFLKAKLPQVSLLFVGAGQLEAELRSQANSDVYFAPFQNQSMMPRTYAISDIVVLPSYGAWETWGLAINEAMCLARPVIVSSHVGCAQDLVTPFENGLIFPSGDIPALADCLQEAFSDRSRLQSWGAASQTRIAQYSYQTATIGLQTAIATLLR